MGQSESKPNLGYGFRCIRVHPNSPAAEAHLNSFFDWIVAAGGVPFERPDDSLVRVLKANENKSLSLKVFSVKTWSLREVTMTPRTGWGGDGMMGVSIRFEPIEDISDQAWRVLEVVLGSPASKAGLIGETDYILGNLKGPYKEYEWLERDIEEHDGKPLTFMVYNRELDDIREVTVMPDSKNPQGALGCDLGKGILHRLPFVMPNAEEEARKQERGGGGHSHSHGGKQCSGHGHSHGDGGNKQVDGGSKQVDGGSKHADGGSKHADEHGGGHSHSHGGKQCSGHGHSHGDGHSHSQKKEIVLPQHQSTEEFGELQEPPTFVEKANETPSVENSVNDSSSNSKDEHGHHDHHHEEKHEEHHHHEEKQEEHHEEKHEEKQEEHHDHHHEEKHEEKQEEHHHHQHEEKQEEHHQHEEKQHEEQPHQHEEQHHQHEEQHEEQPHQHEEKHEEQPHQHEEEHHQHDEEPHQHEEPHQPDQHQEEEEKSHQHEEEKSQQ